MSCHVGSVTEPIQSTNMCTSTTWTLFDLNFHLLVSLGTPVFALLFLAQIVAVKTVVCFRCTAAVIGVTQKSLGETLI